MSDVNDELLDETEPAQDEDGEELFDLDEIEAALSQDSPLDSYGDEAEDEQDGTQDEAEETDAGEKPPLPPNPRTGQPRREDGTFGSKEPTEGEQPAGAPKQGETTPPAAAAAGTQVETPAPTTDDVAPPADQVDEPVRYRADGREYQIPGSRRTAEGIFIPAEAVDETLLLMNRGRVHTGSWQQREQAYQRELAEARTARSEAEVKFQGYLQTFEAMLDAPNGEELLAEFLDNFQRERPLLKAKAERAYIEHLRSQGVPTGGPQPGRGHQGHQGPQGDDGDHAFTDPQLFERVVSEHLPTAFQAVREYAADLMGVPDETLTAAMEEARELGLADKILYVAGEDMPEQGFARGDIIVDNEFLAKLVRRVHQARTPARRAVAEADKARAANAQRLGQGARPGAAPARPPQGRAGEGGQQIPLLPAEGDAEAYRAWSQLPLSVREASARQGRRAMRGKWSPV